MAFLESFLRKSVCFNLLSAYLLWYAEYSEWIKICKKILFSS